MSKLTVKENTYVNIQAFMVNDLHLSGNELIVYAVIYGFSQDENSWFVGSRSYLAAWCQTSEKSVTNNIKKLLAKGLLRKRTKTEHGCTFNDYQAVVPSSTGGKKVPSTREESSLGTGEESSPHTLDDHTSSENNSSSVPIAEIIAHLNEVTGKNYSPKSKDTVEKVNARWSEYSNVPYEERLAMFLGMIDTMLICWKGTKREPYLKPSTLFKPTKFEGYVNMTPKKWEEWDSKDGQTQQSKPQRQMDLSEYSEPRIGSMKTDNRTGKTEVYKGNGVWEEYVSDYVPQEGDVDVDL